MAENLDLTAAEDQERRITLHDAWTRDFPAGDVGLGVLTPSRCEVTETAGGAYTLTLEHPMTADGRWRGLKLWRLIRAPVPACETPAIDMSGGVVSEGVEIWRVKGASAPLYTRTSPVSYTGWTSAIAGKQWFVGDRCTYGGINYRCVDAHTQGGSFEGARWVALGPGAPPIQRTLPAWTRLYVSAADSLWLTVRLEDGSRGYVRVSDAEFVRDAERTDLDALSVSARRIRAQAFRITRTEVDTAAGLVRVSARHVSYDYASGLLRNLAVRDLPLPEAALDLRAMCLPDGEASAPAIYCQDTGVTVSLDGDDRSPAEAILDPDEGLVVQAGARLVRDNWDFFLLRNDGEASGLRLEEGINLRTLRLTAEGGGVVTRVMPAARDSVGAELLLPEQTVDSDRIASYPLEMWEKLRLPLRVGRKKPDGSGAVWGRNEVLGLMRAAAQARFTRDRADEPELTAEVTFAQRNGPAPRLYDWVTVYAPGLGLDARMQVKRVVWDAVAGRCLRMTLGDVFGVSRDRLAGWEISDRAITARKLAASVIDELRGEDET